MRIFLILFLVIHQISLAQNEGAGRTNWGPYKKDPCFTQLSISFLCTGFSKQTGTYFYNIKFKNSGSKNIHFDFDSKFNSGEKFMHGRFDIGAGQEYVWVSQSFYTPPQSGTNFITHWVSKFLENATDDWTLPEFDCDYNTGKWFCAKNCNDNKNNSSNNSNNSTINTQNNDTEFTSNTKSQSKLDELNSYLLKIPDNDAEKIRIINEMNPIVNSTEGDTKKANQFLPLINRAKARVSSVDKENDELTVKSKQFEAYYTKGTDAFTAKNYDNAISNFNSAISIATTQEQINHVNQWISRAQEAKRLEQEAIARNARMEQKREKEQQTNTASAATTAAALSLMALLKDKYTEKPFNVRIQVGIGLEDMALITNDEGKKDSQIDKSMHTTATVGLKFGIANHKGISFQLNPFYTYGLDAGFKGTDGVHSKFGGIGTIQLGKTPSSKVKLFLEGGWLKRSGEYNYDYDVAIGTTSDRVYNGTYAYSLKRFGGGIMFHWISGDSETYLKPSFHLESLSFAPKNFQKVIGLQLNITSAIIFDFQFSKNYAIVGKADYPQKIEIGNSVFPNSNNENYWCVKIIRQGMF